MCSLAGIVLLAVGAAQLSANKRERNNMMNEFNALMSTREESWLVTNRTLAAATAIQQYRNGTPIPGAVLLNLSRQSSTVVVRGAQTEIRPAQTHLLATSIFPWWVEAPLQVDLWSQVNGVLTKTDSSIVYADVFRTVSSAVTCDQSTCTIALGCDPYDSKCDTRGLNIACQVRYGNSAYYVGTSSCDMGHECGICRYAAFLSGICLVVTPMFEQDPSAGYVFDRSGLSCYYPFGNDDFRYDHYGDSADAINRSLRSGESIPLQVSLQIRSNNDPFIFLQQVTKGVGSVPEESTTYAIPAMMIGIGIGMIVAFCCGLGACRRWLGGPRMDYGQGRVVGENPECEGVAGPVPMARFEYPTADYSSGQNQASSQLTPGPGSGGSIGNPPSYASDNRLLTPSGPNSPTRPVAVVGYPPADGTVVPVPMQQ